MGCSRKNPYPPNDGILEFLREGGQTCWKSRRVGGGWFEFEKSLLQGSFWPIVHANQMFSSVKLQCSQTLKIVEIFFSHISHLTWIVIYSKFLRRSFYIAENVNNKIPKNKLSHCNVVATNSWTLKCLTLFYSFPDPVHHHCVISLKPLTCMSRKGMTAELLFKRATDFYELRM